MSVTRRTWLRCSLPPPGIPVFLFNFILSLFTETSAQARPSRSQDRDKATSIKILFNTKTDRTCPLISSLKTKSNHTKKKKKSKKQSKTLVKLKNKVSLYFIPLPLLNRSSRGLPYPLPLLFPRSGLPCLLEFRPPRPVPGRASARRSGDRAPSPPLLTPRPVPFDVTSRATQPAAAGGVSQWAGGREAGPRPSACAGAWGCSARAAAVPAARRHGAEAGPRQEGEARPRAQGP